MSDNSQNPFLSVVVYTRNDGYGGKRHETSLNGFLLQAERHCLKMELILVDWNTPEDQPPLSEVHPWPQDLKYSTVRSIIVPPSVHRTYEDSDKYPVNGGVAFSVGIRRARGEFVLITTCDLLLTDEMMEFLASGKLKKEDMYRVNVYDVGKKVVNLSGLDEQLRFCWKSYPSYSAATSCEYGSKENPVLINKGRGDFILMSRERWNLLHGFPEIGITGNHCDSIVTYMGFISGANDIILPDSMRVYHIDHTPRRKGNDRVLNFLLQIYRSFKWPALFSHIVGKLVYYPLKRKASVNKLSQKGVNQLDSEGYQKLVIEMIQGKRPYVYNDENWGLGDMSFTENLVNKATWDTAYENNK